VRILTVYAHPDDETFGPASVLASYAQHRAALYGLWFTRGEFGQSCIDPPPSPDELAMLRDEALRDVANLIGYCSVEILDYVDGALDRVPQRELQAHVLWRLRQLQPDIVHTFGPAGITRHPDHIAVHHATVGAFQRGQSEGLELRELFFDSMPPATAEKMGVRDALDGQPNTLVDVRSTQHVKLDALRRHAQNVSDAREHLEQLLREPVPEESLYRAWPPVEPGVQLRTIAS
jgi:LmbE family N-acetylglucosaminyl deacetylase